MSFVITGSVNHFANRNEVKELVEKMGGKVTGSVTKKTNYLINNDVESASSKNRKAKELGVPIISEEEFIELAGWKSNKKNRGICLNTTEKRRTSQWQKMTRRTRQLRK